MPTIIDSLLVTFGLDARGFQAGAKNIQDADRKTRDQIDKSGKQAEDRARKVALAYKQIGAEIRNIVLVAAGATGIADFVKNITLGDAATGRLATNLGLATENLSAWEGVITRVGGAAEDADTALRNMVGAFQNYKLTGTTGHDADFQGLGVSLNDLSDPQRALLRIAQAGQRMNRPEFVARLERIGIPESVINLLEKGRDGVERMLAEQRKLGVVTDEDAAAAQRMQDAWAQLSSRLKSDVRPQITALLTDVLQLTGAVERFSNKGGLSKWADDFDKAHPVFGAIDELAGRSGGKPWWRKLLDGDFEHSGNGTSASAPNPSIVYEDAQGRRIARPTPPPVSLGVNTSGGRAVALAGNNPGGINDGAWAQRQPGYQGGNGRYARFRTMEDGIRAQEALLRSYVARGFDTPWKIAQRWAPRGDGNDTSAYARNIARNLGIGVNDRIGASAINQFAMAQAQQENYQFRTLRGARALPSAAAGSTSTHSTTIGTIVVNAPNGDPDTIARGLPHAIRKRGVITQANSGLSG
jgi:hypothetical protein